MNLVHWQVYRVEKVGKDICFNFSGHLKKVIQPRGHVWFGPNFFFTLSLVIFKILSGQNFNIGLESKTFLALKLKVPKNSFGTATLKPYRTVNTRPKLTFNSSFWNKAISEYIFSFLNERKPSLFTNLKPKTWYFKTSFKITYFNTVFVLFKAKNHSKKIWKQHISQYIISAYFVYI
jgi:hypothetical protein